MKSEGWKELCPITYKKSDWVRKFLQEFIEYRKKKYEEVPLEIEMYEDDAWIHYIERGDPEVIIYEEPSELKAEFEKMEKAGLIEIIRKSEKDWEVIFKK